MNLSNLSQVAKLNSVCIFILKGIIIIVMLCTHRELQEYLSSENCKVDERCLIAAHICGDQFAIDFWAVASYYLNKMKREKWQHVKTPTSDRKGSIQQ